MKILLDMNLSPRWVRFLEQEGFEVAHWSTVGDPRATDAAIMSWAAKNGLRTQDVMPEAVGRDVVRVLRMRSAEIEHGAVVSIDKVTSRVRVLPFRRGPG